VAEIDGINTQICDTETIKKLGCMEWASIFLILAYFL
jgi:hypothetical protein